MRTIEEIQQNYAAKCTELGDLVYKQRFLHGRAESLIRDIEALDLEALALKKASEPTPEATPTETKE